MARRPPIVLSAFFTAAVWSVWFVAQQTGIGSTAATVQAQDSAQKPEAELDELKAEIARLKLSLSTAAAMQEIDYHTQGLWFAGAAQNWPLATYYLEKVVPHMRLSANASPIEPTVDRPGETANKQPSVDKTAQAQVSASIRNQNVQAFVASYHALLQGCYDCHKAAGKPYLRPRMPVSPAQAIITASTKETWPK